jgi:hypothetical protein
VLGVLTALLSGFGLINFSQSYLGSVRGLAILAFVAGIVLNGLSLLINWLPAATSFYPWTQWISLLCMAVGFGFIAWSTLNWKTVLIGAFAGGLWFAGVEFILPTSVTTAFTLLSSLTLMTGIWAVRSLHGSARAPAILLFILGALLLLLSWMFTEFSLELALAGSLLFSAGGIHLTYAKLPRLSSPGEVRSPAYWNWSICGILIR